VAGGDLHVSQADAGVEHGGHERVPQHVRVHPRHPDAGGRGQVLEPAGGGVAVHPGAECVAQDRPGRTAVGGPVDRPGHCRRQRNQDDLATLAPHAQHSVAVLLAQVGDVGAAGFEDA